MVMTDSQADVTVSVACKPKIIYPSDSTNLANDLYENCLKKIRDEYELPRCAEQKLLFENLSGNVIKTCIFRNSLLQFELMTILDDYLRLQDGGDHSDREKLRISTLLTGSS